MAGSTAGRARSRWFGALLAATMAAVALVGCSSDPVAAPAPSTTTTTTGLESEADLEPASSPFTVDAVPEGFELAVAGRGTSGQGWHDSAGDDAPYVVLSRGGSTARRDLLQVEVHANGGDEGDPLPTGTFDDLFDPGDGGAAFLTYALTDDIALQAGAFDVDEALLADVLRAVELPGLDHERAPVVADPPDGWEVVGSVDVAGVLAGYSTFDRASGHLGGMPSAHVVGFLAAPYGLAQASITVQALPAGSVDVPALAIFQPTGPAGESTYEATEVDGRPAAIVERWASRLLFTTTPWGDDLVVSARDGSTTHGQLRSLAASVRQLDQEAWEAQVVVADGGPGLHPDPGRQEVSRGTFGDVGWLLQSAGPTNAMEAGSVVVDPCLRLTTHRRACVPANGSADEWAGSSEGDGVEPFTIVATTEEAAAVRIATFDGDVLGEAPLHLVADGPGRAAVLPGVHIGLFGCQSPEELGLGDVELPTPPVRIDLLDEAGQVVGCHGAR